MPTAISIQFSKDVFSTLCCSYMSRIGACFHNAFHLIENPKAKAHELREEKKKKSKTEYHLMLICDEGKAFYPGKERRVEFADVSVCMPRSM